jgi:hypothetical protein
MTLQRLTDLAKQVREGPIRRSDQRALLKIGDGSQDAQMCAYMRGQMKDGELQLRDQMSLVSMAFSWPHFRNQRIVDNKRNRGRPMGWRKPSAMRFSTVVRHDAIIGVWTEKEAKKLGISKSEVIRKLIVRAMNGRKATSKKQKPHL